ncbi:F-box protein CPR1-like [Papaver somniferum]|uniref:F-box protein CPR1-like n=1 Tax=Papaver somniferum TaxID=3469 RepID=UPI000E6F9CD4|nr:F-box protein CPR1-like [Papaver somniferum]
MSSIPEDVYLQILIRVPVKTTFVCKCVCKNWLGLISSPQFIKVHLDFNIQMNNYNIILHDFDGLSKSCPLQSRYASLSEAAWMNEFQDGLVKMDYSFECAATTEFKILPEPPRENIKDTENLYMIDFCAIYALAHDDKIDDYKLVKLVNMIEGRDTLVSIYTLGSNSWKCTQPPCKFNFQRGSGEIISGALHWLVKTATNTKAIVPFDIANERFEELQPPQELLGRKELFDSIGEWAESLCLLVNADNSQFDVWVMQEYVVQESWSKCYSITLRFLVDNSSFRLMWPIKNGKILLAYHANLILYDPKRETCQHLRKLVSKVEYYVESLVSLNSSTYVGR